MPALKNTKKATLGAPVTLPPSLQLAVLGMLALAWIGSAALTFSTLVTMNGAGYGWVYVTMTVVFPLAMFLIAALYAWRQYKDMVQRLFIASVFAISGYAASQILISIIFMANSYFHIISTDDTASTVSIYVLEWLSMIVSLALYVVVIGVVAKKSKGKK